MGILYLLMEMFQKNEKNHGFSIDLSFCYSYLLQLNIEFEWYWFFSIQHIMEFS
jgi:hypothetical protein